MILRGKIFVLTCVLVLCSNEEIVTSIKHPLNNDSYKIIISNYIDCAELIELLKKSPIDILIMDLEVIMHEKYDLVGTILLDHPEVSIIAVYNEEEAGPIEYQLIKKQLGIHDILKIPISSKQLIQSICKTITKKQKGTSVEYL